MQSTAAREKVSRRLDQGPVTRAEKPAKRTPYKLGQSGSTSARQTSGYQWQLLEDRRLRAQYGLSETEVSRYFSGAAGAGITPETLLQWLETRLDSFVYRAGFATTVNAARQYVNYGQVLVNGQLLDRPSYQLKAGDTVTIKPESGLMPFIRQAARTAAPPAYIGSPAGSESLSARLLRLPALEEVPVVGDLPLVINYYSR